MVQNKKACMFGLLTPKYIHAMTGTRDSLGTIIGELAGTSVVRRRILQTLFPLLLTMPWRLNFKQMARWSGRNEGTIDNWFGANLKLIDFQRSLIDKFGSGDGTTPVRRAASGRSTGM
jgi:hypothetical protein